MGRSARFAGFHQLIWDAVALPDNTESDRTLRQLALHGRVLQQVSVRTQAQERAGMTGHITEHLLKTAADYRTMTAAWETARWQVDHNGLNAFAREVGDAGVPMIILGPCPVHKIMLEYAGYENFYLHLADFPDTVETLLRVMEKRYEKLWREVAQSTAEIVLHGAHWSTDMTPPPVFRRFFLPYFQRFSAAMHRAGKQCVFHADADLSGLTGEVLATGMDVADCFACAPLVKLTLREARQAWADRVIIWGGIPSTILMPSCPVETFRRVLSEFLLEAADGRAVIAGVSDNVMPGSVYERIVEMTRRVLETPIGAAS